MSISGEPSVLPLSATTISAPCEQDMTEGKNCLIISLPFQFKITTATFATLPFYINVI